MVDLLQIILPFCSLVPFMALIYEYLTTDEQKRNHIQKLSRSLIRIQSVRSLELAQNDARLVLSWLNRIYGKTSENRFLARDFWGRRPVCVSILIATTYVCIAFIFFWDMASLYTPIELVFLIIIWVLPLILINAFFDLISVNVSRILFFKMSTSCHLRNIISLILLDFGIASLLYLTVPICVTILNSYLGAYDWETSSFFMSIDSTRIRAFYHFLELVVFWKAFEGFDKILYGAMFLTTLVPTAFHLLVSFLFFLSKIIAQPLRLFIEKIIEYMLRLPKGVTALFAFLGAIIIYVLVWIISDFQS